MPHALTRGMAVMGLALLGPSGLVLYGQPEARSGVSAIVLGIAQDAGIPHIGCRQALCVAARRDPSRRERVACLGLVDDGAGKRFLIDATPDLASQIESLNAGRVDVERARPVDGILLTHAHIGHYSGLMYLGREGLGSRGVPVYSTPRMAAFLRKNGPWSQLVDLGNIDLQELTPDRALALTPRLTITPFVVPHRDEFSDTVGFRIQGPSRTLLYVPDIDKWERWERRLEDELAGSVLALLDGTFDDPSEIPGRSQADIPHPLVGETASRLSAPAFHGRVFFTHVNHTNRLLWDEKARAELTSRGLRLAKDGEAFRL